MRGPGLLHSSNREASSGAPPWGNGGCRALPSRRPRLQRLSRAGPGCLPSPRPQDAGPALLPAAPAHPEHSALPSPAATSRQIPTAPTPPPPPPRQPHLACSAAAASWGPAGSDDTAAAQRTRRRGGGGERGSCDIRQRGGGGGVPSGGDRALLSGSLGPGALLRRWPLTPSPAWTAGPAGSRKWLEPGDWDGSVLSKQVTTTGLRITFIEKVKSVTIKNPPGEKARSEVCGVGLVPRYGRAPHWEQVVAPGRGGPRLLQGTGEPWKGSSRFRP